jgi:glycosyltransferase involved in cell wall biosynthesis
LPSSERIRVLEVLASLQRAGAEHVAVSLVSCLDRALFACEVVSLYDAFPGGFEPTLEAQNIAGHHLGKRPGFDPRMYPRLRRVIRSFQPAIVHTHSYVLRYAWPANAAARGGGIVHTVHNLAAREVDWLGRAIQRAAFRTRQVTAVAVGDEVAKSFRECYGVEPRAVIPNGVDLQSFQVARPRGQWKRANGFADRDRLVVSVARLEPQKNPLALIEAFHTALGNDPAWRLLLAGKGRLETQAREHAARLGIAGRVHLLGVRHDLPELLPDCDLFALAADWEGMPVAVIEAMAAGLPVAATDAGGLRELVDHGRTGLLSPAGNIPALADSLAALARDPRLREAFAHAARERAERYGLTRMVQSYAELFTLLAAERARP